MQVFQSLERPGRALVAAGQRASHFASRQSPTARRLAAAGLGALLFVLLSPLLAVLHELVVLLAALALRQAGQLGMLIVADGWLPFDPVYTGMLFYILRDIEAAGLAVASPVGLTLHALLPGLFVKPELVAGGALVSAVIQPGASALSRGLAGLQADAALIGLGLLLVRSARPAALRGRLTGVSLLVVGAMVQADLVFGRLRGGAPSLGELEATGLTYGLSVLFTGPAPERPRVTALLAGLPPELRDLVLALGGLALVYLLAAAWCFALIAVAAAFCRRRRASRGGSPDAPVAVNSARPALGPLGAPALAALAIALAVSPAGALVEAETNYLALPAHDEAATLPLLTAVSEHAADPSPQPLLAPSAAPAHWPAGQWPAEERALALSAQWGLLAAPLRQTPRRVTVSGSGYNYRYEVDGQLEVIRGMGYNPMLAGRPRAERAALYDRDFPTMRDAGVNTLVGWTTDEFDELLLDKAEQYGLGVILPYHLDPELDYSNQAVREQVAQDVVAWVERYKRHPALRIWGLGNEVLHKLVFPSWMQVRGDPVLEARADNFASLYVYLIDKIHQLDPDHPVTYRMAEDAYLPRLKSALAVSGDPRPWFILGVNVYTPRLGEVIDGWPRHGVDAPLLVSEFGPGGAGPSDRPQGYRELWGLIRSRPERVIGGAAYVWFTEGPEEVDRIFGFVDPAGRPVDGALGALASAYRSSAQALKVVASSSAHPAACDARILAFVDQTIAALQRGDRRPLQGQPAATVMGAIDNLSAESVDASKLYVEQADSPAREALLHQAGYEHEWWASWTPAAQPGTQLTLVVRERDQQLQLAYVYHGPAVNRAADLSCAAPT